MDDTLDHKRGTKRKDKIEGNYVDLMARVLTRANESVGDRLFHKQPFCLGGQFKTRN